MRYFTRGGQIIVHQVLMWIQVVIKLTVFSVLAYAVLLAALFLHKTSNFERKLAWQYWLTKSFSSDNAEMVVEWSNGKNYTVTAGEFLATREVNTVVTKVRHAYIIQSRRLLWWILAGYLFLGCLLALKGYMHSKRKFMRGAKLVSPAALKRRLQLQLKASRITIGGVPLVKEKRRKHILLVGATGSGKTQGILELLTGFREEGYKVIVIDPECSALKYFYRGASNAHDTIINPMDKRAKPWDFWNDARNESQLEYMAASLVPEPKNGADPFWNQAARVLFLETAKVVLRERAEYQGEARNKPGIKRLLSLLTTADLKVLEDALKGTIAESLVSRDAEKLALSVKSTLAAYLRCLELLEDTQGGFSIRNWVHDKNDAWLFITSREDMHETFKPLLSVILDVVANEMLTLDEDPSRKIAIVIDEEASLNPSRSLQEVRARGGKRGIQVISGYQTTAQAVALSGIASAQALSAMYGTRVYFACNDADSAQFASRDLGQQEVIERVESTSLGANTIRDGVSLSQQRRVIDLVMPNEVTGLHARQAFLRLSGEHPVAKIKVPICTLPKIADGFIAKMLPIPIAMKQTPKCEPEPSKNNIEGESDAQQMHGEDTNKQNNKPAKNNRKKTAPRIAPLESNNEQGH